MACSVAWPVDACGMNCGWCSTGIGFDRSVLGPDLRCQLILISIYLQSDCIIKLHPITKHYITFGYYTHYITIKVKLVVLYIWNFYFYFSGRIAALARCGLLLQTSWCSVVSLCVFLCVSVFADHKWVGTIDGRKWPKLCSGAFRLGRLATRLLPAFGPCYIYFWPPHSMNYG